MLNLRTKKTYIWGYIKSMTKNLLLMSMALFFLSISACSFSENVKENPIRFAINNWSSGLGSVDENSLDKSKYSYTLYLTSETDELEDVKDVALVIGDNINDKIIQNEQSQIEIIDDSIIVKGEFVFDTQGLTKAQILELEPYITSVRLLMNDKTEYIVELNTKK